MKRAVVVGTNGFPFLMGYWLQLFERTWCNDVDKVYLAISEPAHPSVWPYVKTLLRTNEKIEIVETNGPWPVSVEKVLKTIDAESIGIFHDDLFVLKPGVVDRLFKIVEKDGLAVVPLHANYSIGELVEELMQRKWPDQLPMVEEGTGRSGYSFFANFFMAPSELIHKTSMNLGGFSVPVGQRSDLLDWTPLVRALTADTDFFFFLELLEAGAKFYCPREEQLKSYLYTSLDIIEQLNDRLKMGEKDFLADLDYIHYQTFSYHINGLYEDIGAREELERQRGSSVPRRINNIPVSPTAKSDALLKIATIDVLMKCRDYSGIQRYVDHAKVELKYIRQYFGIKSSELKFVSNKLQSLLLQ